MGSELEARGIELPAPAWTARAVAEFPEVVAEIHRAYAEAGADVHTTATFRTRRRSLEDTPWAGRHDELARRATDLCRAAVEAVGHGRVAGGLAPLEDCFRPDLTPDDAALAAEHAELAEALADAGCDLLLVETMPTERELVAATRAAVATGLPVWAGVTYGPELDFFDSDSLLRARDAFHRRQVRYISILRSRHASGYLYAGLLERFQTLIRPPRNTTDLASHVHGITREMVAFAPTIDKVLPRFFWFIQDSVLMAHNAVFDID